MADLPDINVEWPDAGHEAIRQAVVQAVADLLDHAEQLGDSFLLAQTAGDALGIALTNVTAMQAAVTDQATTLATLQQTVTDLQTTVTDLQTSVSDLQATVTSQGDAITALQTQTADLDTRVTALETPTPAA